MVECNRVHVLEYKVEVRRVPFSWHFLLLLHYIVRVLAAHSSVIKKVDVSEM